MANDFQFFSKNGQILPIEEATISLSNIAYSYGFGVYESLKVRNGIIYFVDEHIERLFHSANIIGLQHSFTREQIEQFINDLTVVIKTDSYNLKILLIGGTEPLLCIMPLAPHYLDRKFYSDGVKTVTFHNERIFPQAKSLNMLPSYIAYTKAREVGGYDSLLIDSSENIVEGTRSNFFTLRDTVLFTPPKEKILEGVTKLTVLDVAQKNGFTVSEKDIPLSEIASFDGAFLTSTSAKIVPIKQIDDFIFPQIPEKLRELMRQYDEFLDMSRGKFSSNDFR